MSRLLTTSHPLRCAITGASGFLGGALVNGLVQRGHSVLAVVRPESDLKRLADVASRIELAYAPLEDVSSLQQSLLAFQPDVVFHLAWWGGNSKKYVDLPEQALINIPGSLGLLPLAHEAQAKTFIFFGSVIEYGRFNIPVSEEDAAEPENLYGITKLAVMKISEKVCTAYGMRFCGVRPFWIYGPGDSELRMIPSLIEQLLNRKRPSLTPGEQLWDFLYIDDATDALIRLAENPKAEGIFNLASGKAVQLKSVMEKVRDLIDPSLELGLGDIPYAPDQIMHLQGNIHRLEQAADWKPAVELEEGLRRTVAWHVAQRRSAS